MPIEAFLKNATGLPDKYVEMAITYINYLQTQYQQSMQATVNGKPILRTPGKYEGMIFLAPDFDAPLDDFKEYL